MLMPNLVLTDFDQTGLNVPVLALITAGVAEANGTNYRDPTNGGPLGSLDPNSDIETVTGQTVTRVALHVDGNIGELRIWDNPSTLTWTDYFNNNPNVTLRFQTETQGPFEFLIGAQGGNFSTWSTGDSSARAAMTSIGVGDMYLLVLAEPAIGNVAPSFATPTGPAQSWTQNTAITPITVPAASGTPAPTYAAVGNLPAGILFNASTRVLSGTPTSTGTGTITIEASNSEGTADWTVTFTTTAGPVSMTDRLLIADNSGDALYEIDPDGADQEGTLLRALPSGLTSPYGMTVLGNRLLIADDFGNELYEIDPDAADQEGTRLRALPSGLTSPDAMTVLGNRLLIADSNGDDLWEIDPDAADSEGTRLRALPSGLSSPYGMTVLGNRLLIADNSGDELWEIDPDAADQEGTLLRDLPSGLTTPDGMTVLGNRLLIADSSGDELYEIDPDGADSEGTLLRDLPSGLTTPYGMAVLPGLAVLAAPAFADNTGDPQTWGINQPIAPIIVPEATGVPTPSYTAQGALPAGIGFNPSTRVISGTPTATGSGTITIRAINSEGRAEWTVTYTVTAGNVAPSFVDDTGNPQTWTENQAVTPVISVPAATGTPTPSYAVVGTLPAGIVFNAVTRSISGTPRTVGSGTITIRGQQLRGYSRLDG